MRYFNPQQVFCLNTNTKTDIEINCYSNGIYWVCPNTKDLELSKEIEEQFQKGMYITKKEIYIKMEGFYNEDNWND